MTHLPIGIDGNVFVGFIQAQFFATLACLFTFDCTLFVINHIIQVFNGETHIFIHNIITAAELFGAGAGAKVENSTYLECEHMLEHAVATVLLSSLA